MWIAAPIGVLISRCVWHSRNYGHGKLLAVVRWSGRGVGFVDGLCDRCAQRIHPDVRPQVIRGGAVPRRGCTLGIVVAAVVVMVTALLLMARPTANLPIRQAPMGGVAQMPREESASPTSPPSTVAPSVASLPATPRGAPSAESPPRRDARRARMVSSSRPSASRLSPADRRASAVSAVTVSRARASRPLEVSRPATARVYPQSP